MHISKENSMRGKRRARKERQNKTEIKKLKLNADILIDFDAGAEHSTKKISKKKRKNH